MLPEKAQELTELAQLNNILRR